MSKVKASDLSDTCKNFFNCHMSFYFQQLETSIISDLLLKKNQCMVQHEIGVLIGGEGIAAVSFSGTHQIISKRNMFNHRS